MGESEKKTWKIHSEMVETSKIVTYSYRPKTPRAHTYLLSLVWSRGRHSRTRITDK